MSTSSSSTDKLASRILWGLVIGLVLGLLARGVMAVMPDSALAFNTIATEICDPAGQVFLRLLFFVVVPLVFSSLALGVAQLGDISKLGPMAGRTFALFGLNMAVGVALGLIMMNLLNPGNQISPELKDQLMAQYGGDAVKYQERAAETKSQGFNLMSVVNMFMPQNLLKSVVEFNVLPLILFALLVGAAATQLAKEAHQRVVNALQDMADLMTRIVHYALLLAPIAVPAMMFSVVVRSGLPVLKALAVFVIGVLAVMLIHLFGSMSLMLKVFSKRSPLVFFKAIRTVVVTAFSTSSSNATLPTSIQVAKENLGVSPSTAGFVLPLGATMNMSGTALYEGCVVLFIAQVFGVDLSMSQQLTLLLLAVLSAVAVAGVPGGSLPLIVGLMMNFGIPPEGIAIILGTDRILDMSRTVLNVAADLATACIVDDQMGGNEGT
ncbi:MAG: dicarboxylate/amino acid:cation symporter [Verrucomicrobiota bacterium]